MSADALITRGGPVNVPLDYNIPATSEIIPLQISATFADPTNAGPYVPAFVIETPDGQELGPYPLGLSIAAGASARVSWFPGLGAGAGGEALQALVGARIRASSTQTVADNTLTDLHYQTVEFDTDGMASLGANDRILTVNTPGMYLVLCETTWIYNSAGRRINQIVKNGYYSAGALPDAGDSRMAVWAPVGGDGAGNPHTPNIAAALFSCVAGDFFSSGCLQASGGALDCNGFSSGTGGSNCFLSAVAIGVVA